MNNRQRLSLTGGAVLTLILLVWLTVTRPWIEMNPSVDNSLPLAQLDDRVHPLSYQLDLTLLTGVDNFTGKVVIDLRFNGEQTSFFLHGKNLVVEEAFLLVDTKKIPVVYKQLHASGVAQVRLPEAISGFASLVIAYQGQYSETLDAIYKVKTDSGDYLFSQLDPIAGRMVFPGFDEPRFKVPFSVSITSEAKNKVITNGPLSGQEYPTDGMVRHSFETTKPLPTYLLAFAVGDFDIVEYPDLPPTSLRDSPIPLRGIAVKGQGKKMAYALDNTQVLLEALEAYFQIPYPYKKLDIIAPPDFPFGAMENAGAIFFQEELILLDEESTLASKKRLAAVYAHEISHQWFGNLVTPKWWDDVWLNESFATWIMYKIVHQWKPDYGFAHQMVQYAHDAMVLDGSQYARRVREPITSNDDVMNAFDSISYIKGGSVLEMFERAMGEQAFQRGIQNHLSRFRHGVADAHDFIDSLASQANSDAFIPAFKTYLLQPGVPQLQLTTHCAQDGSAQLVIHQKKFHPTGQFDETEPLWQVPFCFTTDQQSSCEWITQQRQELTLYSCPAYLLPNSKGAGYYRWSLDESSWRELLAVFNQFTINEQLSVIDNLGASYLQGGVSADLLLEGLQKAAQSNKPLVMTASIEQFIALHNRFSEPGISRGLQQLTRDIFGEQRESIHLTSQDQADQQAGAEVLRLKLAGLLANYADDPILRQQLSALTKAYLYRATEDQTQSIDPALLPLGLKIAVETLPAQFSYDLYELALQSEQALLKRHALVALTRTKEESFARFLLDNAVLSDSIPGNIAGAVLQAMLQNPKHREMAWAWFKAHHESILKRYSSIFIAEIIHYADVFCDQASANDVETFFLSIAHKISGSPRKIKQVKERIEQCVTVRDSLAPGFEMALSTALAKDKEP